jgi:hypothetical protein
VNVNLHHTEAGSCRSQGWHLDFKTVISASNGIGTEKKGVCIVGTIHTKIL